MLVFANVADANAYVSYRSDRGDHGLICRVEDTRTKSGLLVQWRDVIVPAELNRRMAEARWLLEEVLAGRIARPKRGEVIDITTDVKQQQIVSTAEALSGHERRALLALAGGDTINNAQAAALYWKHLAFSTEVGTNLEPRMKRGLTPFGRRVAAHLAALRSAQEASE